MRKSRNGKAKKKLLSCGPYNGLLMLQRSAGTLPIKVGNWHGRYNANNEWEQANHG